MLVHRKDKTLNEVLEYLDGIYEKAQGDQRVAFAMLSNAEAEWIAGQVDLCQSDERYYLENYHVIRTESQTLTTLYPLYDAQEIFYATIVKLRHDGRLVRLIVLKARQLGLTTVTQAIIFRKTIFTELANTAIVAQDPEQAAYVFDMSRLAYDNLPWWMRPEIRYDARGKYMVFDRKDERERQSNPGLRSNVFIEAANKMSGVLVGKTLMNVHLTELSLWADSTILEKQIVPSLNAPDQICVMESTARGRQHWWYRLWNDAVDGQIDWTPVFIPFYSVKKYSIPIPEGEKFIPTPEEQGLRDKILTETGTDLTDGQLNFRRQKERFSISTGGDVWGAYEEFPATALEAFQSSGLCAFNKKKLHDMLNTTCCRPRWYGEILLALDEKTQQPLKFYTFNRTLRAVRPGDILPNREGYGGRLHIWEWPKSGERYYVSGDVAMGQRNGDFSVGQVFRYGRGPRPDTQVAEWKGWIGPTQFASVLAAMGYFYFTAQIACEANGEVGALTNRELFRTLEYPELYRWTIDDKLQNFMTDYFGWYTTGKTRPLLIAKFREAIDQEPFSSVVLRSEDLVDQAFDFSAIDGGRFEGQAGHDDLIMSAMIGHYCMHNMDWANPVEHDRVAPENEGKGKDFFNTDYSPLHDYDGIRKQMKDSGKFKDEEILYSELDGYGPGNDKDWRDL